MPSLFIENNVHLDIRGFVSYASRLVFFTVGVGYGIAEDIHARIGEWRARFRRLPIENKIGRLAVGVSLGCFLRRESPLPLVLHLYLLRPAPQQVVSRSLS